MKKVSQLFTRCIASWRVIDRMVWRYQVLEYCEHHRGEKLPTADESQDENRKRTTDISEWDSKFIAVDQEMLFEIILAANYLDIKPLLYVYRTSILIQPLFRHDANAAVIVTLAARRWQT